MAAEWYCAKNGQQIGPMSLDQLRKMLISGQAGAGDLVWNADMTEWRPASEVPELQSVCGARHEAPVGAAAPPSAFIAYQGRSMESVEASPRSLDMLRETRPWVRFVSVLLFIAAGLMIVSGLVLMALQPAAGCFLLVIYALMSLLQIFPGIFLGRYATKITEVLSYRRSQDLEAALEAQKSFWKFIGIMLAIILGIYAVMFLVLIVLGGFAMFR